MGLLIIVGGIVALVVTGHLTAAIVLGSIVLGMTLLPILFVLLLAVIGVNVRPRLKSVLWTTPRRRR